MYKQTNKQTNRQTDTKWDLMLHYYIDNNNIISIINYIRIEANEFKVIVHYNNL